MVYEFFFALAANSTIAAQEERRFKKDLDASFLHRESWRSREARTAAPWATILAKKEEPHP